MPKTPRKPKARRRVASRRAPALTPAPPSFTVEDWPISRPQPYPNNPRQNAAAVAKVAASLKAVGFRQPIVVDEQDVIIVGHTRLLAAQSLGWATVPVHVARGLTPAQVRAYRLADNRSGEEATWDEARLAAELGALDAGLLDATGFDADELARFLTTFTPQLPELGGRAVTPADMAKAAAKLAEQYDGGPRPLHDVKCPMCGTEFKVDQLPTPAPAVAS